MMPNTAIQLIAQHVDGTTHTFELGPDQGVFVGKSTNCGLRLDDEEISDIHCRIDWEAGQLWIQDWMSKQGTCVNGVAVTCKSAIDCSAQLAVGSYKIQLRELPRYAPQPETAHEDSHEALSASSEEPNSEHCSIARFNQMQADSSVSKEPVPFTENQPPERDISQDFERESRNELNGIHMDHLALNENTKDSADATSVQADETAKHDDASGAFEDTDPHSRPTEERDGEEWSRLSEADRALDDHEDLHPVESRFAELDSLSAMALEDADLGAEDLADDNTNIRGACEFEAQEQPGDEFADFKETSEQAPPTGGLGDDFDFFDSDGPDTSLSADNDEVYDRETVALLHAEIENLRAELAAKGSDSDKAYSNASDFDACDAEDEQVVQRIRELSEEANRAEERVILLEEMLQAADDANRGEVEERQQLEAWVGDIERRIGQREQEHAAELEALRARLRSSEQRYLLLQRQLEQAASPEGNAREQFEETLENLQFENSRLQNSLDEANKELKQLRHQIDNQAEQNDSVLREARAKIAKEQAEVSRLKFEYAQKLEVLSRDRPSVEPDPRLQALREHRQQIREQQADREEQSADSSLSGRLKRLWSLVE